MRDLLFRSRIFNYLAAATPGLKELVTIGKIWELTLDDRKVRGRPRATTCVIVDAPATGHGVGFLQTPRTFANIARVGPIRQQAETLDAFIRDRKRTGVAVVALPEEMPVNETATLERDLAAEVGVARRPDLRATGSIRSGSTSAETERIAAAAGERRRGRARRLPRRAHESRRARRAARAARRGSRRTARRPVTTLPFLFEPEARGRAASARSPTERRPDAGVAELLDGQADLHLRRLGRRRQDDHVGGDRGRDGGARASGSRC